MALTFTDLQTEFYARGFADLNDGGAGVVRAKRWLNDAMHEIDGQADWPYRESSTTGIAPLTVSDLGTVQAVTDTTTWRSTLQPAVKADLRRQYGDLTTAGSPVYFYLSGTNVINVYPTSTSLTLTVDYLKVGTDLSAGSDEPAMPDRFRMSIVDYAVERASRDRGDEAGARAARAQGDARIVAMANELLLIQHQGAQQYVGMVGDDC